MTHDKNAVRKILAEARAANRAALTAPEARGVCEAYGITIPREGVAKSADDAAALAADIGFPVVMKIVSPQILHKTEAGGVMVGVKSAAAAKDAYATIVGNAKKYDGNAEILGVQVQQMVGGVEAGRARADDGDPERSIVRSKLAHSSADSSIAAHGARRVLDGSRSRAYTPRQPRPLRAETSA